MSFILLLFIRTTFYLKFFLEHETYIVYFEFYSDTVLGPKNLSPFR